MRQDNTVFASANSSVSKSPRAVLQISFDSANADLLYLTSHSDTATPPGAVAAGLVIANVIESVSSQSQSINPDQALSTIGALSFKAVDMNESLTAYQRDKLDFGRGLRHKQVILYVAYEGFSWADYQPVLMFVIDDPDYLDGVYNFKCSDIQRITRKDIFDPETTTLSASVTSTQLHIPVHQTDLTKFPPIEHDSSYTDRPNETVSYARINDEKFCHSGLFTHATDGVSFQVVAGGRGALNTLAAEHTIDVARSDDRQTKITEHVFLEGPAPKILNALLTGNLENQPGQTLPNNFHLGVDTQYVRLAEFTGIGNDLWNTATEKGRHVRFEGVEKTDGKKFIEKELLFYLSCFMPVRSDGALGLRRLAPVLSNSGYLVELNAINVVSYGALNHDYSAVINNIDVEWNYDYSKEDYTKNSVLIDAESIAIHGEATKKTVKLRGAHTGAIADKSIFGYFDQVRDRFSGPPLRLSVSVLPSLNYLEVGDAVNVNLAQVRDINEPNSIALNRVFEVQKVSVNWLTGDVKLELFGSSQKAGTIKRTTFNQVMDSAYWASEGVELSTVLTIVNGVITEDGHLSGAATFGAAVYYYLGNLELAAGVRVTFDQNVTLKVQNFYTINGDMDGKGRGHAGGAGATLFSDNNSTSILLGEFSTPILDNAGAGVSGVLGSTKSSGNLRASGSNFFMATLVDGVLTEGALQSVPNYNLQNNSASLDGLPSDLRGASGAGGRFLYTRDGGSGGDPYYVVGNGGDGGNGGAGLLVICGGMAFGVSGSIDTSGDDGVLGGGAVVQGRQVYAGSGGGGAPGGLLVVLDGQSTPPELVTGHVALQGDCPVQGTPVLVFDGDQVTKHSRITPAQMVDLGITGITVDQRFLGFTGSDWIDAAFGLQYIPEPEVIEEEQSDLPPNVSNFTSEISGENTLLKWDRIITTELSHFEIREGTAWATATVLSDLLRLNYFNVTLLAAGTYNYLIKAVFYSGKESAVAALTTLDATAFAPVQAGATVGADWNSNVANLPDYIPAGISVGGFGDIVFTKNLTVGGVSNIGEVRVQGSSFYHPDGSKRTVLADTQVHTKYEGNIPVPSTELVFLMWTDASPLTRFSAAWNGLAYVRIVPVVYIKASGLFYAEDNVGTRFQFLPLETDCVMAQIIKTSTSGGIDSLNIFVGSNVNLPADNATAGATWGVDVGGSNLPANNATVGATWGVNIGGSNLPANNATVNTGAFATLIGNITYSNMGSYFDPGAIDESFITEITAGTINVANLSAISAILGSVTAGAITSSSFSTSNSGQRVEINVAGSQEIQFFGVPPGVGGAVQGPLASMGLTGNGTDFAYVLGGLNDPASTLTGVQGSSGAGYGVSGYTFSGRAINAYAAASTGVAVYAINANSGDAVFASSISGISGHFISSAGTAVQATVSGADKYAVWANSANGYGGRFGGSNSSRGPVVLVPSTISSAPTHTAVKGTLWVTSAGVLYCNNNGSTGWNFVG